MGNLKKTNEKDCSTVCEGDEKIMCGGGLKKSIFEASGLPPEQKYLDATVELKEPVVINTIQRWLDYQNEDTWKEYCNLKDLRQQMQLGPY